MSRKICVILCCFVLCACVVPDSLKPVNDFFGKHLGHPFASSREVNNAVFAEFGVTNAIQLVKVADSGNAKAQYILGLMMSDWGSGFNSAISYINDAAKSGYPYARLLIARLQRGWLWPDKHNEVQISNKEYKSLLEEMRLKADSGDALAQGCLGRYNVWDPEFSASEKDVTQKQKQAAFNWYRKAAEQGLACAQFQLAECYQFGIGTPIKPEEAFNWYMKSAQQGWGAAQIAVAYCYETGLGTPKDISQGKYWRDLSNKTLTFWE